MNDQGNEGNERKVFLDRQDWDVCGPESRLSDQWQFEGGFKKKVGGVFFESLTYYGLDTGDSWWETAIQSWTAKDLNWARINERKQITLML